MSSPVRDSGDQEAVATKEERHGKKDKEKSKSSSSSSSSRRDKDKDKDRHRDKDKEKSKDIEKDKEKRKKKKDTDDRDRDRDKDRDKDKDRGRAKEKDSDRERRKEKEREKSKSDGKEKGRKDSSSRDHGNKPSKDSKEADVKAGEDEQEKEKDTVKESRKEGDKSKEREKDKDKDRRSGRDRDMDRDRGRDRGDRDRRDRSRSRSRSRSRRREKKRSRSPKRSPRRSRSRSSRRGRDRESKKRGRHAWSPSSSRSKSRSRSRSKKKSKFDVAALTQTLQAVQKLTDMNSSGLMGLVNSGTPFNMEGENPEVQRMIITQMQAANPQVTRQARRLYVGNLPVGMGLNEKMLCEFFNATVSALGVKTPNPVLSVWLSSEATFCFVEFRSVQDATACMSLLQGISLGSRSLRVGRPADYKSPPPALQDFIVGYPNGAFAPPIVTGPINTFNPSIAVAAAANIPGMAALVGGGVMEMAAMNMIMAATGGPNANINPARMAQMAGAPGMTMPLPAAAPADKGPPTKSLTLLNMVNENELVDDDEFHDIVLDVREECEKYGTVEQVIIPRPLSVKGGADGKVEGLGNDRGPATGVDIGRIFVTFLDEQSCAKAVRALDGRMFNNNKVEANFTSPGMHPGF